MNDMYRSNKGKKLFRDLFHAKTGRRTTRKTTRYAVSILRLGIDIIYLEAALFFKLTANNKSKMTNPITVQTRPFLRLSESV